MTPAKRAIVALVAAVAFLWLYRLSDAGEFKEMVVLVVALILFRIVPELLPVSWPRRTMGQQGDGLIGFEVEVSSVEPLRVEAHGAVWTASLVGGGSVRVGSRVRVVDRDGLTLLVEAGGVNGETA